MDQEDCQPVAVESETITHCITAAEEYTASKGRITNTNYHSQPTIPYDLTRDIDWNKYAEIVSQAIESADKLPPSEEYSFLAELIHDSAVASRKHRLSPWWDQDCTKLYEEKSNAFKRFRKRGTRENMEKYFTLQREMKKLIKAKKMHYSKRFTDEQYEEDDYNYAKNICPDFVPASPVWDMSSTDDEPPFSFTEFSFALLSCNNTAPGLDMIKFDLLKNLPDNAKHRILELFNSLLEHNIVPNEWKKVKVIAVQKPDGNPINKSYSPIVLLPCIRKLLEKMILNRLKNCAKFNAIISTQFDILREKQRNDYLNRFSTDEHEEPMTSSIVNAGEAFSSVCLEVLFEKFCRIGFSTQINNFLFNLLREKHMHFSTSCSSIWRTNYMGLPQGSCLSPFLYNIYVSNMDNTSVE